MENLRSYPAYKASGVLWLGQVPEHWDVLPARAVYRPKLTKNLGMSRQTVLSLSFGRIVVKPADKLRGLVPESFETYQLVDPGDIVVRTTDLQNDQQSLRVGISNDRGIITSAYMCLGTTDRVSASFGYQLLNTYDLLKIIYGFGSGLRQNLDFRDIKQMLVPVPPRPEQAAIVRFLDDADRRVRRYIAAKRKLIALLNEQKQAIIHRAVTRGLDPRVRLKPSGVGALSEVPAHWAVLPLKRWVATKITDGPHETPEFVDDGIPFLSAESMTNGHLDFTRRRGFVSQEAHETYCKKLRPERDDIFMCKSGATTGKVAIVDSDDEFSVWSPLALIRANRRRVIPRLFWWVLQDQYIQRQVQETWSYGTQPNLSMASMERLLVVLPPIEEQAAVVDHLEQTAGRIVTAMDRARREIDLIREYRTRLIADVVTGKLDVREAAARLPDEIEEAELLAEVDALTEGDEPEKTANLAAVDEAAT
jgi:type I restriction enzyme S subunit